MPIYEYRCAKCHTVFEEWHRHFDEESTPPCPECRGNAERIVSNTTFMLKGGGWYVTDYGNRKNAVHAGGESAAPAPAPSACENKGCASAAADTGCSAAASCPAAS